jgi:hypothetical protein
MNFLHIINAAVIMIYTDKIVGIDLLLIYLHLYVF